MTWHPYLLRLLSEIKLLTKEQYFEPVAAIAVFFIFFLIGRKSYESKFTHVLNTINDCENEKKRLTYLLKGRQDSQKSMDKNMFMFRTATLFVILCTAAYTYINKFSPKVTIAATSVLIVMWGIVLIRKKYLKVMIKKTETSLHQKLLSSQADAKEIISLLGDQVCKQLKVKFQRQLDVQWRTEEIKDCDLRKCEEEKSVYKDLYQLYKDIIGEMQKMQWCDICSQTLNLDANDIKLSEIFKRLDNYKAISEKLSLEKKKQLTNRLLEEWQMLEGKLPFMCRRGCCIRFRSTLEDIKRKYHDKLRSLKSRQSIIKA